MKRYFLDRFCFLIGLWCVAEQTCHSDHSNLPLITSGCSSSWNCVSAVICMVAIFITKTHLYQAICFQLMKAQSHLPQAYNHTFHWFFICHVCASFKPSTVSMGTETDSHLLVMSIQSLTSPLFARACLSSNRLCCELSVFLLCWLSLSAVGKNSTLFYRISLACCWPLFIWGCWCFIAANLSSALLLSRNTWLGGFFL